MNKIIVKLGKIIEKIIPASQHRKFNKMMLQIEKRIRFVLSALILSAVMLVVTTFFFSDAVWYIVPLIFILTYILTYFSLLEGIEKGEWYMLFIMPVMLTLAFYFLSFLFPPRWLYRTPMIMVYGFSIYAVLLTSNIFNVGVEKSIQLYRAAFSVNYFFHALISFILTSIILSFKQHFWINDILTFIVFFVLSIQLYWSVKPRNEITRPVVMYGALTAFLVMQIVTVLSFVPLNLSTVSLLITAAYYCISGLLFHQMEQRLFSQTMREYLFVVGFVLMIVLLSLRW